MKHFSPTPDQLEQARSHFQERHAQRRLMDTSETAAIGATRLFAFLNGAEDLGLTTRLKTDFALYRTYKSLLKRQALHHIPMAIAASSETYPVRDLAGCVVRLQEARADSDQLYLIIELQNRQAPLPKRLHLSLEERKTVALDLPMGRNGIIQAIIPKTSLVAELFKNPKTELFLT